MEWTVDNESKTATSVDPVGYRIAWASTKHGNFYNCILIGPPEQNIGGSYNRDICKRVCQDHALLNSSQPTSSAASTAKTVEG